MLTDQTDKTATQSKTAQLKLSREQKLKYCEQWEKSGLSKANFCSAQNISIYAFRYWYYYIYSKEKKKPSQWAPVVTESQCTSQPERMLQIEIVYPNQVMLRVTLSASHAMEFIQELSNAIAIIR
jgi:hypothetical protein